MGPLPGDASDLSFVLTVAPTGPIATKADNPTLPTQPHESAEAVHNAYQTGASVAHLHFRDPDGRPTADLEIASLTMDLIQERCPILIQLSTGVGLDVPFSERAKLVEPRPSMAILNPCSMSFGPGEFHRCGHRKPRATQLSDGQGREVGEHSGPVVAQRGGAHEQSEMTGVDEPTRNRRCRCADVVGQRPNLFGRHDVVSPTGQ